MVKSLLDKLDATKQDSLHAMVERWLCSPKLKRAAFQACSLFLDALGAGYRRHLATLLPPLRDAIEAARDMVDVGDEEGEEMADDAVSPEAMEGVDYLQEWSIL